jgi:hypothetical protein
MPLDRLSPRLGGGFGEGTGETTAHADGQVDKRSLAVAEVCGGANRSRVVTDGVEIFSTDGASAFEQLGQV